MYRFIFKGRKEIFSAVKKGTETATENQISRQVREAGKKRKKDDGNQGDLGFRSHIFQKLMRINGEGGKINLMTSQSR
jgi:hypothetical protein